MIIRREVLNNLIQFKNNLEIGGGSFSKQRNQEKRIYLTLINVATGDLRFAQNISTLDSQFPRTPVEGTSYDHWKQVRLIVQDKNGRVSFQVCDINEQPLNPSELKTPIAREVLAETMDFLNTAAKVRRVAVGEGLLPEQFILFDIQERASQGDLKNLEQWVGKLNRIEAEEQLSGQKIGAYLIRELDDFSLFAFKDIQKSNQGFSVMEAYVLTRVEREEKISDILLIKTDRGWTFFQDNIDLSSPIYRYYPSIQTLLDQSFSL